MATTAPAAPTRTSSTDQRPRNGSSGSGGPGGPRQPTGPRPSRNRLIADAQRRAQSVALRRSLVLLAMTLFVPGSAQLVAGNARVGRIALRVWGALIAVALLAWWRVDLNTLARLAVNSWFLFLVQWLGLAIAAVWAILLLDAWRLGQPPKLRRGHRVLTLLLALALAFGVTVPFRTASSAAQAQRDLVASVFPSGEAAQATGGRLNVLLLGGDAAANRDGVRPDSITLVSVDTLTGSSVMLSLPRNLQKARFPDGTPAAAEFPNGFKGDGEIANWLLNATYTYGEAHPEMFAGPAGPGLEAVKQAVSGTLGQPVHYFVLVNLNGFKNVVDALGGLTIRVEESIRIGTSDRVIKKGLRTLDGYETLWYARSRSGSNDYVRMGRQRCVLNGILREADPKTVLKNFTELASSAKGVITTDIPASQLPALLTLAVQAKDRPPASVQFVPPLITPADPDIALIQDKAAAAIERASAAAEKAAASAAANGTDGTSADSVSGSGSSADSSDDTSAADDSAKPAATADHTVTEAEDVNSVCRYS